MNKQVLNHHRAIQGNERVLDDKGDTSLVKMISSNSALNKQPSVSFIEGAKDYENEEEKKTEQKERCLNDNSNRDRINSTITQKYVVPKISLKQLYSKQRRKMQLIEFLNVSIILVAWITSSILISLPLLLIPNSLSIIVKTPYIALWMAILAHFLIFKKLFPSSAKLSNIFTWKGILLFLVIWVVDSAALSALIWFINYWNITSGPQYFILITAPISLCFLLHFLLFYILYACFLPVKSQATFKYKAMALLGVQTLVLQLTVSLYFAYAFEKVSAMNGFLGASMWALYPLLIGAVKEIEKKMTAPFNVGEIYEFAALSLAAMPYRFVFLGVDRADVAGVIVFIKYTYKLTFDFIIFTPWYIKLKNKILCKKSSSKTAPNMTMSYINRENTSPNSTPSDVADQKTIEQSQKFFYQQFLDFWDILAALIIVIILRQFDDNSVSELKSKFYILFIFESSAELVWEAIFTVLILCITNRWTVLKDFSPLKFTKKGFKENLVYFTVSSLLIFPLFIYIMFSVRP
jgi:hypothetical protein